MALTQNELDKMRKDYSDSVNVKQSHFMELPSQDRFNLAHSFTPHVSTACLTSHNKVLKSPHVSIVIEQLSNKNLKSCEVLLDSRSDINLISMGILKILGVNLTALEKLSSNIVLRGSTGSLKNPFQGKLKVTIRFWHHKVLTAPKVVTFHVLKPDCDFFLFFL